MLLLTGCYLLIALAFVVVSVAPGIRTGLWWIRCWDFPRLQLGLLGLVLIALAPAFATDLGDWAWALAGVILAFSAVHLWRVGPFTPFWPVTVMKAKPEHMDTHASLLLANVLMENRDFDRLATLIRERDPDILFLTETDQDWADALEAVVEPYPYKIVQPQPNHYGLIFATRLAVDEGLLTSFADVREPLVRVDMRFPSGDPVRFWGLHPEPPIPQRGTEDRDADLMVVAQEVRRHGGTTLVGGDLNDVAWSHTTRLFLRISGLLDPRRGRGRYSSFHADYKLMRWPLDHVFVTDDLVFSEFALERHVGSDHFPVWAVIGRSSKVARKNAKPALPVRGDVHEMERLKPDS